jgi:hypothetical protein
MTGAILALLLSLGLATGGEPPAVDPGATVVAHDEGAFRPDPAYQAAPYDPAAQEAIYGGKHLNPTARPLVELGRPLFDRGAYERAGLGLGDLNPTAQHFLVYGDVRVAAAWNDDGVRDAAGETGQGRVAVRLNLDFDWKLTATERLHFFIRPFDKDGRFLRYDFGGKDDDGFEERFDSNLETLFFEGEVGPIVAGLTGRDHRIDIPFAVGLVPLLTQNGVWLQDAFEGLAFTLPAKSSAGLDISNFDLTFFAGFGRVTTPAAPEDGTRMAGFAGFVDAHKGYWEWGYGYVDAEDSARSYHNVTVAFSKRWGAVLSQSVRVIGNFGQDDSPGFTPSADGWLLLVESSLIGRKPYTVVPYVNLFFGVDRPQALARAAGTGGVVANTGIAFESDGLTGSPFLDDSGAESFGGALGWQNLFDLDQQLVLEVAGVDRRGDRSALGAEYGVAVRWQKPVTNAWLVRADGFHGWRDEPAPGVEDTFFGLRLELRRKF